ncbi:MAG: alcohol dehydrogenase catalytic domain-containing protein [Anaerolineaceae bacterium]|nr:alcohol dehydrogenase catalytic domain-containing protein [Anaerolineaceae bacterium]
MKAAYYSGNGTIEIGTCQPVAPGNDDIQIQVAYGGICGTDLHIFRGAMSHRVTIPQIMGHEISGTVAAVGANVSDFSVGDRVTVMPLEPCNCPEEQQSSEFWYVCEGLKVLGLDTNGGFQSFWTVPARTVHKLPDALSLTHGALMEPLAVACHAVRRAKIMPGESVVVLGGGPIGTLVALVARAAGGDVIVAEINPYRIDRLRTHFGFEVVSPPEADLKSIVLGKTGGKGCDAVFEVTGHPSAAALMTELPRVHGRIMITGIFATPPAVDLFKLFWREITVIPTRLYDHQDFSQGIQLAASGTVQLDSIITNIRPLDELQVSLSELSSGANALKVLMDMQN